MTAPPAVRRRRGRPPDAGKHDRILKAATAVFLERGFQAASMDQVARRARVSKVTIYAHFAGKQALLGAIIDSLAGRLLTVIRGIAPGDLPPSEALTKIGRAYLRLALAPSSLALHRLVVAEAARQPRLGLAIHRSGPTPVVAALADYLERQEELAIAEPGLAAEQFFGMVLGHAQISLLLAAQSGRALRGEIDHRVASAVRVFLRGVTRQRAEATP